MDLSAARVTFVFRALLSLSLCSCSGAAPADDVCEPDRLRSCQGVNDCVGTQRCTGEASSPWSACECLPPDTGEGDAAELGAPCASNEDCPEGAFCLREEGDALFGGGPPSGMCVANCGQSPEACATFSNAVCVEVDAAAYCFPSCTFGPSDVTKCGERTDLACEATTSDGDAGFCRPICTRDEQCSGRRCDRRRGVCSDASNVDDFGLPCDPDAEETGCSGVCVTLDDEAPGFCSHRCLYGDAEACNGDPTNPGLCAFASPGGSLGDVGYCAELCDCSAECSHSEAQCDPFSSQATRDLLGKAGVCTLADDSETEPLVCTP